MKYLERDAQLEKMRIIDRDKKIGSSYFVLFKD